MDLGERLGTGTRIAFALDRLEERPVKEANMLHGRVAAVVAMTAVAEFPVEFFAGALAAVVVGERIDLEEAEKRK